MRVGSIWVTTGLADVVSFTDFYPHGSALPGRNYTSTGYRYNYQGQEKDAETGLLNFELRQMDPRIGRWFAPDPMHQYASPYSSMANNPIITVDPDGGQVVGPGYENDDTPHKYGVGNLGADQSQFDINYDHGGPMGGSINADGSFYSDYSQVYDAHQLRVDNIRASRGLLPSGLLFTEKRLKAYEYSFLNSKCLRLKKQCNLRAPF